MSGMICNRRIAARLKEKGYEMVVRPAMKMVALTERQEAELKVLIFSLEGQPRLSNLEIKLERQG